MLEGQAGPLPEVVQRRPVVDVGEPVRVADQFVDVARLHELNVRLEAHEPEVYTRGQG